MEAVSSFDGEVSESIIRNAKKEIEFNTSLKETGCEIGRWMELYGVSFYKTFEAELGEAY
jgi:hypothetical protein